MNVEDFRDSLSKETPPEGLSAELQALWYDARGDWDMAHKCVQDDSSTGAAEIHAYLHRKEGDRSNASYWYRRAGVTFPSMTLTEEWDVMATNRLSK